jgi:DNA-directed RNA polymerase subunit RPC12/RpoP
VASDQDLFFGKIAVNRRFCTQAQLDKCRILQANSRDRVPLGQLLRSEGYITGEQHDTILTMQRRSLSGAFDPVNKVSKQSILLGKLAVRENLMAEADVNACLRIEAQERGRRTIGQIMVAEGYIGGAELKALLAKQEKRTMSCVPCGLLFTVISMSLSKVVACPRCKGSLIDARPKAKTDAQIETRVSHKILKENAKKVRPNTLPVATKPSESVRMVKMNCPMCAKDFQEPVDSKGRVDCPHCLSSFSA